MGQKLKSIKLKIGIFLVLVFGLTGCGGAAPYVRNSITGPDGKTTVVEKEMGVRPATTAEQSACAQAMQLYNNANAERIKSGLPPMPPVTACNNNGVTFGNGGMIMNGGGNINYGNPYVMPGGQVFMPPGYMGMGATGANMVGGGPVLAMNGQAIAPTDMTPFAGGSTWYPPPRTAVVPAGTQVVQQASAHSASAPKVEAERETERRAEKKDVSAVAKCLQEEHKDTPPCLRLKEKGKQ